jgi:hypothetical protein
LFERLYKVTNKKPLPTEGVYNARKTLSINLALKFKIPTISDGDKTL